MMNLIQIEGGIPLRGETRIQGSKNAVLPILAATVLIPGISRIKNCPNITDVDTMIKVLRHAGCKVSRERHDIIVDAAFIGSGKLPKEEVIKMRSSILLLAPLLIRTGDVSLDYPGGCTIGERPIDLHLKTLTTLGAEITEEGTLIRAKKGAMEGNLIRLSLNSVGATETGILAAVCSAGVTHIFNAAKEPEIVALCDFLVQAGAKIQGAGTTHISILGQKQLHGCSYKVPSDRIVAGTYLFAGILCSGTICLTHAPISHMEQVILTGRRLGAQIQKRGNTLVVTRKKELQSIPYVKTDIYPGFPTDLQSMLLVTLSLAKGVSVVEETIFENRFKIVKELQGMGADIAIEGQKAYIRGKDQIYGKQVVVEELRGGAALVLAGLKAQGITVVSNVPYIERGYENICKDLKRLGARITRE